MGKKNFAGVISNGSVFASYFIFLNPFLVGHNFFYNLVRHQFRKWQDKETLLSCITDIHVSWIHINLTELKAARIGRDLLHTLGKNSLILRASVKSDNTGNRSFAVNTRTEDVISLITCFISTCSWFFLLQLLEYSKLLLLLCIRPMNGVIGLVGRVSANGPGDLRSIPDCVIPKTLKMVLDISLLYTQQYKVRIKVKVDQFKERSGALLYTSV